MSPALRIVLPSPRQSPLPISLLDPTAQSWGTQRGQSHEGAAARGEMVPTAVTAEHPWMDQIFLCTHPWVRHFGAAGKPRVWQEPSARASPFSRKKNLQTKEMQRYEEGEGAKNPP